MTLRPMFDALAFASKYGPVHDRRVFAVSNLLDLPAAILVPTPGTRLRPVDFPEFPAEWVWHRDTADPDTTRDSAILYFHGGGFVACGLNTHRRMVARIARASRIPILNVAYCQLPKAHITTSIDDGVTSYKWLLDRGFDADRIIVAGDSAGGGLAFGVAIAARDRGLPVPGGIVAISPWVDLDCSSKYAHPNRRHDPMLPVRGFDEIVALGFAIDGKVDPSWSPVNHDMTGLPTTLIQVGSTECLLPDAELLAKRLADANVACRLQIWDRAPHVHHAAADVLPDARAAIREIGAFNQQTLFGSVTPYRSRLRTWIADHRNVRSRAA